MEFDKPTVCAILIIGISQIVLIFLKLLNIVNWSWLWILAPLWMPYLAILFAGSLLIVYLLMYRIKERLNKENA